jgi:TolB protein
MRTYLHWPSPHRTVKGLANLQLHFLLVILGLLLPACTNPEVMRQLEELAAQHQAQLQAQNTDPANRLLVQGVDGNLFTIRPDGSDRVPLTNHATSLLQYTQPTWSPTGQKVAWSELDNRTGELKSALVVSHFNGLMREHIDTPFAPFYLHWSPDGAHLAYLSNWLDINQTSPTIALRLVDFEATGEKINTLVEGQPLYLTWSPASDRLLIHIDNDRLEFWDVEGDGTALAPTFAAFPAPQWSSDGNQLLYALGEPGVQQLVLADPEGNLTQEITDFSETISFSMSPTGDAVAYAITPPNVGTAAFGPLYVVDLASARTRELTSKPVMAFFWSPDGSKLAYLVTDESENILRLRWQVWDGDESKPYAAMVPSRTFLQAYLIFFDQYARSMTIWSPDSSAFAYAALDPVAGNNIWVQRLEEDEPQKVGRGVFVAWSPR